jgi:hypothetical protein
MSKQATATFQIKSWDETSYAEFEKGAQLTRANAKQSFSGDMAGEGSAEYLMFHRADSSASFVGMEHFVGKVGGRWGSFVLQHQGAFDKSMARSAWTVVADSGTGELHGLRGEGSFVAPQGGQAKVNFEYEID